MKPLDPLNVNERLYRQVAALLDQLEKERDLGLRERIAALVAVGRIQTIFVALRKEGAHDGPAAGSAVRKYASAFASHAGGRRKKGAGRPQPDTLDDDDTELYDS